MDGFDGVDVARAYRDAPGYVLATLLNNLRIRQGFGEGARVTGQSPVRLGSNVLGNVYGHAQAGPRLSGCRNSYVGPRNLKCQTLSPAAAVG